VKYTVVIPYGPAQEIDAASPEAAAEAALVEVPEAELGWEVFVAERGHVERFVLGVMRKGEAAA